MRRLDARTEQFLLGRPIRAGLSPHVRGAFAGARLLVTGAGGSVGSELARQLAACGPDEIVLFDHAEYLLFRATRDLQSQWPDVRVVSVLGDVSRPRDIAAACRAYRPGVVFHAAACKHVTIAEQCVVAAARTNVLGAVFAARAARSVGARFVLISTDKASDPHSVMGATKRLAELCVLGQRREPGAIAVRFGNVLGSSGSVVEILMDAARAGQRLTVTDPDATRFFMTAAEAVTLLLKAAVSARTGEVFWLDMGRPLRLGDLVDRIVDVVTPPGGLRAPVDVVGLRPGEKRHEVLTSRDLTMERTDDVAIWRARQAPILAAPRAVLERLRRACRDGDATTVLETLADAVPGYAPSREARVAAERASAMLTPQRLRRRRASTAIATSPLRRYA